MKKQKEGLAALRNVGKATLKDLHLLGIETVEELATQDPTHLYKTLEAITGPQDPCVWDVFAAIIHEAKTGEATNWWTWTAHRKKLQLAGKLQAIKPSKP